MKHGFYGVAHKLPRNERRRSQMDALLKTAANNLDTLHLSYLWLQPHERGYKPGWNDQRWALYLLREAQKRGVQLMFEDTRELPTEARRELATHPAFGGFGVLDDVNAKPHSERLTACDPAFAEGARRYISISAAQNRPELECYGLSEQIGVQIYPYQFADNDPKTQPAESLIAYWPIMAAARQHADQHGQQLIANLQIHRNYSERHPTPEQVRALAWMAQAAGVDGVLWYALLDNDPAGAMWAPSELVAAVRDVTAETRAVTGRPTTTRAGDLLTANWPGGTRVVIDLAANQVLELRHTAVSP